MSDFNDDSGIEISITSAEQILECVDDNHTATQVTDAIANLLILCHERKLAASDIMINAMGHYCATYIEDMTPEDAYEWLNTYLFPWTGDRQFAEYAADKGIILSGHRGSVKTPEWGV